MARLDELLHLGIRDAELLRQLPDDRDTATGELVDVLGEEPPLDPRLAVELCDLVHRCLDARGHISDPSQSLGHGVGTLTESDQLPTGVGQFGKLEGCLGPEFAEAHQRFLGLGGVADQGGERHLGLLEICGCVDRLHSAGHRGSTTRERTTDPDLEGGAGQREAFL